MNWKEWFVSRGKDRMMVRVPEDAVFRDGDTVWVDLGPDEDVMRAMLYACANKDRGMAVTLERNGDGEEDNRDRHG